MTRRRRNNRVRNIFEAVMLIVLVIGALYITHLNDKLDEQYQLKQEIVADNNALTIRVVEMQKQVDLLIEKIEAQKEVINRLKKLETADKLKAVVMAEAGGSSIEDMCAVAQTVLDRATLWGMDVDDVISAPAQYANPKYPFTESAEAAVELVFIDGYRPFTENTTHFHADYVNPYWAANKTCRGIINRHKYYY